MESIYHNVGFVVTWLIIALLLLVAIYSLFVGIRKLQLLVKTKDFYNYYIQGTKIESDQLRRKWKVPWVVKKHKKYILLYRLRNIRTSNKIHGVMNR